MNYLTINGKTLPTGEETTVLEVARRAGIWIPTLCHHPGLTPYGACRLCIVEVKAGGRSGLTASCTLPATEGLVVETDSIRVRERRRVLVQLLLAAAPDARVVQELARKLGVNATPFPQLGDDKRNCTLCGLCVRVCERVGGNAIGFAFRGVRRRVVPPFHKPATDCLGCRACAGICPTGEINFAERGGRLFGEPWQAELGIIACSSCGQTFTPEPFLNSIVRKVELAEGLRELCSDCRRRRMSMILE